MITKVYTVLSEIEGNVPVLWNVRPDLGSVKTAISYYFFNESDTLHGDGNGSDPGGSVQVSVFSTGDYTSVVNQVKTLMKQAGFRLADSWDSEDSLPQKYYQKIIIFNYLESEVIVDV